MTEAFAPWYFGIRGLLLRSPEGPRTPDVPVPPPPGLEPSPVVPDEENGYLRLVAHVEDWPSEGANPPDLNHRRKALPADRESAERALEPVRPKLEGLDEILEIPVWQIPAPSSLSWPELPMIRRLGHALLLRHALEGRPEDRQRAITLAHRLRRSESPMIHFLVGIAIEKTAEGPFSEIKEERREAVLAELRRIVIPNVHLHGPWSPVDWEMPPAWLDESRAIRWLLRGHPAPYDPAGAVAMIAEREKLLTEGSRAELEAEARRLLEGWPSTMISRIPGPATVPVPVLWQHRASVAALENPYGRLSVARTLQSVAGLVGAVEACA